MVYLIKPLCKITFVKLHRLKIKYFILFCISIFLMKYFGVFTHLFEKDFYIDFHYPYEGDIRKFIEQLRQNEKPDVTPINIYNYTFISNCEHKCKISNEIISPRLVYLVKSAMEHSDQRITIRNTWGYEHRFSDVIIRLVFIVGISNNKTIMNKIKEESKVYKDIVQVNFLDSYYNNTIKTMTAFKWAMDYCPSSKFYMFVDDDMYVSTKNVLRFIRNPTNYPNYLKEPVYSLKDKKVVKRSYFYDPKDSNSLPNKETPVETNSRRTALQEQSKQSNASNSKHNLQKMSSDNTHTDEIIPEKNTVINAETNPLHKRVKRQVMDFELPDDVNLYSGYVIFSAPHRHMTSKWFVSLEEYPYHLWPPYITGGSYILSREALKTMYYTSFYTKHFRFDDIYLGLVALKANIEPYHCPEFHFYKKKYDIKEYQYVITSHGYVDSSELERIWNEQRSAGNA